MQVCGCFNRGFASASIGVDKDRYMPGETANIVLQVGGWVLGARHEFQLSGDDAWG